MVFYSSVIIMMHGPTNIQLCWCYFVTVSGIYTADTDGIKLSKEMKSREI